MRWLPALLVVLSFAVRADNIEQIHELWNYAQPAETEELFHALLADARESDDEAYLPILLSQLARTHSLRGQFEEAQGYLREASELTQSNQESLAHAYVLIEQGRVFNSAGDRDLASTYFQESFRVAELNGDDYLATDAAHMVAIAAPLDEQMKWNLIALGIAETSDEARARNWKGSLYNNIGWTWFEQGKYAEALEMFEKAAEFRREQGQHRRYQIARWAVARTLRALGRNDEALEIQLILAQENEDQGMHDDGYVMEELGELYLLQDDAKRSALYFSRALAQLAQDDWFVANEPERLARIRELAQGAD